MSTTSACAGEDAPIRVLMLLCQKICATGSGVVVKELIDRAAVSGVEYALLSGGYADDDPAALLRAQPPIIEQVRFEAAPPDGIPTPIAGMSNRMPYRSKPFRDMTPAELDTYETAWSRAIARLVDRFQPHVIHAHHLWLVAAIAARVSPWLPIVVSIHGTDLLRADDAPDVTRRVTAVASRFARFIALTPETVASTLARYDVDERRFTILGNGFNEELHRPDPAGDGRDPPRVLFVGKYERWKGIEWLLRAFARLRTQATLTIAGSGPEDERRRYETLVASLGIDDRVELTGLVAYEDVGKLMRTAAVFVLPAIREPFGLALLEALACGCRVVSTDHGGPPYYVPRELRERGDAILIEGLSSEAPPDDEAGRFVEALAVAIEHQLTRPRQPDEREKIAASVRHLTWDTYVRHMGELYRVVTAR